MLASRGVDLNRSLRYRKHCEPGFAAAVDRGARRICEALQQIVFERITPSQWD